MFNCFVLSTFYRLTIKPVIFFRYCFKFAESSFHSSHFCIFILHTYWQFLHQCFSSNARRSCKYSSEILPSFYFRRRLFSHFFFVQHPSITSRIIFLLHLLLTLHSNFVLLLLPGMNILNNQTFLNKKEYEKENQKSGSV